MLLYDIEFKTLPKIKYNCSTKTRGNRSSTFRDPKLLELCLVESGELVCETSGGNIACEVGHLYPLLFEGGLTSYCETATPARITSLGIECEMSVRLIDSDGLTESDTRELMKELLRGNRFLIPQSGISRASADWVDGYMAKIRACKVGERIGEEARAVSLLLELMSRITRASMDEVAFETEAFPTSAIAYSEMTVAYITKNYRKKISVADIAEEMGLSQNYLHSIFKQVKGCTITEYLTSYRMELARTYIERFGLRSYEAAQAVGIDDPAYFSRVFKKLYGISVNDLKHRAKDGEGE